MCFVRIVIVFIGNYGEYLDDNWNWIDYFVIEDILIANVVGENII